MKDKSAASVSLNTTQGLQQDISKKYTGSTQSTIFNVEKIILEKYLQLMGKPEIFLQLPDGSKVFSDHAYPEIGAEFLTGKAIRRFILNPNLSFGEDFSRGNIRIHGDLLDFMTRVCQVRATHQRQGILHKFFFQGLINRKNNSLTGSKENIYHHYDVGNEFYQLWLDKEMQYTCAYFPQPEVSLETAQLAKMEYVCKKLRLKPGDRVVEAGCGWGGLSRYMAKHYGVKVKAYNISHQQILEARKRAKEDGLDDRVEYIEDDYRNIKDECDVFVSVGMLEHVGRENYSKLGEVIDNNLTEEGRGLIHSIGQNEPDEMNAWLEKHIFPGSYPPTLREMMAVFEPYGFTVIDIENIRLHYAKTCDHWLTRVNQHEKEITEMFDEEFFRAYQLYLAGSVANFLVGGLQLFQVVFTRRSNNEVPWTRNYLYQDN